MNAQIQILFLMVAGWVNRHQQAIIEYLQEENRVLLKQLGGKPKRFTDAQRIGLARKAQTGSFSWGRTIFGQASSPTKFITTVAGITRGWTTSC